MRANDDPHLRSIEAVTGYHIHATDGEIGHVEDFLVEDADWSSHYLIVDTKNWWSGEKVLISSRSAWEINWSDRLVNLDVDRQKVKDSPAYHAFTTVDGAYEQRFHSHYGDIRELISADPSFAPRHTVTPHSRGECVLLRTGPPMMSEPTHLQLVTPLRSSDLHGRGECSPTVGEEARTPQ